MTDVIKCCKLAKQFVNIIANLSSQQKNDMLKVIADSVVIHKTDIIIANKLDLQLNGDKPEYFLDRLMLNDKRIDDMRDGVNKLIALEDPIGESIEKWDVSSGLEINKIRVPLGVIGIIYEARPNVTLDAIGLTVKTGNAVVLRGSKDAINSNLAIMKAVKTELEKNKFEHNFIQLINDTSREGAEEFMKCRQFVDVLIPRGSASLISTAIEKSSIPIIETGTGNCHAYVEKTGDLDIATNIILNGKLQRPSVCNALESIIIDSEIASAYLPKLVDILISKGVELVGCKNSVAISSKIKLATEEDFYAEFLALKLSIKIVENYYEAIDHINKYSTHHSDVIISKDEVAAKEFLQRVDSAVVYVNASTRFTDGYEFGFGAEMGISTQKLHARGPLGLKQLTSEKYQVIGNGQIR